MLAGFCGSQGYTIALSYYPPLVVVNLLLLEPIGSQIIGYFMGYDHIPGPLTFVGLAEIIFAVNLMHRGNVLLNTNEHNSLSS